MKNQFRKYKQNLSIVEVDGETFIKSYQTHVAKIQDQDLKQLGYWSKTTQKHINYAAKELNLNLVLPK